MRWKVTMMSRWGGRVKATTKTFASKASATKWKNKAPSYLKGLKVQQVRRRRR